MLKEICITPQIFKNSNSEPEFERIKFMLQSIKVGGYIIDLNNGDWYKEVNTLINNIADIEKWKSKEISKEFYKNRLKIQGYLKDIIVLLKDRDRICGHPKNMKDPKNENDWIEISKELNKQRNFSAIVATKHFFKNILTLDDLSAIDYPEIFGLTGTKHHTKTEVELKNIFKTFLSYARKVTIIDPYFDISENRYKTTLNLIAETFRNKRGNKTGGHIVINLSKKKFIIEKEIKDMTKYEIEKLFSERVELKYKKWKNVINDIFKKYNHTLEINIWDRKDDDATKMHDRYIITNQAALVSPSGMDKDDYQLSDWGIKDYDSGVSMLAKYNKPRNDKEDNSIFKLEYTITGSGCKKK